MGPQLPLRSLEQHTGGLGLVPDSITAAGQGVECASMGKTGGASSGSASFTVGTYNIRGPITVQRFLFLLQSYPSPLPSILGFTEFSIPKGSFLRQYQHVAWVTHRRWLLASMSGQKAGVALLVDSAVVPGNEVPATKEEMPGRVLSIQCRIHASPSLPSSTIAVVYGSCVPAERAELAKVLNPMLDHQCILLGDWNAITELAHSTTSWAKRLVLPWLQAAEREGSLVDLSRAGMGGAVPMTRARGHPGVSYLDRVYATKPLYPSLSVHSGCTGSVRGVDGQENFSDHDFIHVEVVPWTIREPQHPHPCASWSRKHVKFYRRQMAEFDSGVFDLESMEADSQVPLFRNLSAKMKLALDAVNARYPPKAESSQEQGHNWHEYVQHLVRLARRNPSSFVG